MDPNYATATLAKQKQLADEKLVRDDLIKQWGGLVSKPYIIGAIPFSVGKSENLYFGDLVALRTNSEFFRKIPIEDLVKARALQEPIVLLPEEKDISGHGEGYGYHNFSSVWDYMNGFTELAKHMLEHAYNPSTFCRYVKYFGITNRDILTWVLITFYRNMSTTSDRTLNDEVATVLGVQSAGYRGNNLTVEQMHEFAEALRAAWSLDMDAVLTVLFRYVRQTVLGAEVFMVRPSTIPADYIPVIPAEGIVPTYIEVIDYRRDTLVYHNTKPFRAAYYPSEIRRLPVGTSEEQQHKVAQSSLIITVNGVDYYSSVLYPGEFYTDPEQSYGVTLPSLYYVLRFWGPPIGATAPLIPFPSHVLKPALSPILGGAGGPTRTGIENLIGGYATSPTVVPSSEGQRVAYPASPPRVAYPASPPRVAYPASPPRSSVLPHRSRSSLPLP